jgi:GrpB-like predicted nucleotidyltransferase (UPF0157 family)
LIFLKSLARIIPIACSLFVVESKRVQPNSSTACRDSFGGGRRVAAVVIADYDPEWPSRFAALASTVAAALGPVLLRVEHVGSTAVPGLPAKPVIDLDAVVPAGGVPEAVRRLEAVGYTHKGDQGIPDREAFRPPDGSVPHHLYVCPSDNPEFAAHLRFRDALRADDRLAAEYARLKRELAARFGADRAGYCEAKTAFVRAALARSSSDAEPGNAADGGA